MKSSYVNVADYRPVTDKLARVILAHVSIDGKMSPQRISAAIAEKFDNMVAPVERSFVAIDDKTMVGYVRANVAIVPVTEKELKEGYRVMGSAETNVVMSNKDRSLWNVRRGTAGTILSRQSKADMAEVIASKIEPSSSPLRFNVMASAMPEKREFASFVTDNGEIDHGFCVRVNASRGVAEIMSMSTKQPVLVEAQRFVSRAEVKIPKSAHRVAAAKIAENAGDVPVNNIRAYYDAVYAYAPDYLAEVQKTIDDITVV